MSTVFVALLPVFIVILVGWSLRRFAIVPEQNWQALDQLCYYVLFPAIIFKEIAAADFTSVPVFGMAASMMLALALMFAVLLIFHRPLMGVLRIDGPQFTSLFQGASRWHTFIAFAIIPLIYGPQSLSLGAVSAATMTPLLNVTSVIVMTRFADAGRLGTRQLALSIIRNPFVFSSIGGVLWQAFELPTPQMGIQVLDMIGRGALGLALLTVGAGLRIDQAVSNWPPVLTAAVLKLLAMPMFMAVALSSFGVTGDAFAVAMICAAVPTGSGAYVLARQMGGDAAMVANMLTLQVVGAALTIPLVLTVAGATG